MRPHAERVESQGSIWFFDPETHEYLRMPKTEGPRPPGPNGEDWGGPGAGALQDLVWHPYTEYGVLPTRLIIARPDGPPITAPMPWEYTVEVLELDQP